MSTHIPLSLYIHIPWCIKKCPYCDFNSHQINTSHIDETSYLNRLIDDLQQDLMFVQNRSLASIFIGGGTPSVMSGKFYQQLLQHIAQHIDFDEDIEITLEANPGSLDNKHLEEYAKTAINRLSFGVQSFNAQHLQQLGRIHTAQQAQQAILHAQQLGFSNINIDLMHGLPQQTQVQALDDLTQAMHLGAKHISWYQLTIEQNTVFYTNPPQLPSEDSLLNIYLAGQSFLKRQGYQQYEVSAYTQNITPCKHNINYWQFGDYIGIGAGAHGKITTADKCIIRTQKTRVPKDYLRPYVQVRKENYVTGKHIAHEFFINALRLNAGFTEQLFKHRTDAELPLKKLHKLVEKGLLSHQKNTWKASAKGRYFIDSILVELLD